MREVTVVNPRRACARVTVLVLCVCVSVCLCIRLFPLWLLQRPLKPANNDTHGSLLGFSWILTRGFSKKPSVKKLWREKANMQMIWSSTSAVFAYFRDKRNAGTTRRATGQSRVASSATYQCKWPKTTEILGCKASRERNYYADVTRCACLEAIIIRACVRMTSV